MRDPGGEEPPGRELLAGRSIDRASPVPYYYQLQEILKEEIEAGRWQTGDRLPSEAELEAGFGVSRTVVRQALDVLEADGQLLRQKGIGSIVAQPKFRVEGVEAAEVWGGADSRADLRLSRLVDLRRVVAGESIGRLLGIRAKDPLFELTYVQSTEATPISLTQSYLRQDASEALAELASRGDVPDLAEDGPDPLIQLCDRYGLVVVETRLSIETSRVNQFESELIGVAEGAPVFLLSAIDIDKSAGPIRFSRSVVRTDVASFTVVIPRRMGRPASGGEGLLLQVTGVE
jgi:GntR family transcriptional regulator